MLGCCAGVILRRSAPIRAQPVIRCRGRSALFSSVRGDIGIEKDDDAANDDANKIRLSRLVASHGTNMQMSRRSAERMIRDGLVSIAGDVVTDPSELLSIEEAVGTIKVGGRQLLLPSTSLSAGSPSLSPDSRDESIAGSDNHTPDPSGSKPRNHRTRVWLAHKLQGELVTEDDPYGRPSLLDRLRRGGVGKPKKNQSRIHLKPVGRLDMMTEGLLIVTNDGGYAREMELPKNKFQRTYRARVHGRLTESKLRAIRNGIEIDNTQYGGMDVRIEKAATKRREQATNTWLRITCVEGKNRQIRRILEHLGLNVTRLIRTHYGDYSLNTIPPGMAIEVPVKALEKQKKKGQIASLAKNNNRRRHDGTSSGGTKGSGDRATVHWVRHV